MRAIICISDDLIVPEGWTQDEDVPWMWYNWLEPYVFDCEEYPLI